MQYLILSPDEKPLRRSVGFKQEWVEDDQELSITGEKFFRVEQPERVIDTGSSKFLEPTMRGKKDAR